MCSKTKSFGGSPYFLARGLVLSLSNYYNLWKKYAHFPQNRLTLSAAQYRMIVTDRLHGMLFAAITRTPCIVFDNFFTVRLFSVSFFHMVPCKAVVMLCTQEERKQASRVKMGSLHKVFEITNVIGAHQSCLFLV